MIACAWCGQPFTPRVHNARYCGSQCKERAHRAAHPENRRAYAAAWRLTHAAHCRAYAAARYIAHPERVSPRTCEWCGTTFTPKVARARFCRRPCAAAARRAIPGSPKGPPTSRPCVRCGKAFTPKIKKGVFCGSRCQDAAWRAANPEKVRASYATYEAANRAKRRARDAARRAAHPEKIVAWSRAYYSAHRQEIRVKNAAKQVALSLAQTFRQLTSLTQGAPHVGS